MLCKELTCAGCGKDAFEKYNTIEARVFCGTCQDNDIYGNQWISMHIHLDMAQSCYCINYGMHAQYRNV